MRGMKSPAGAGAIRAKAATRKKLKGDFGEAEIEVPRDGKIYTLQIVAPHQPRFTGFGDKVLSSCPVYAWRKTMREIQSHIEEISAITGHEHAAQGRGEPRRVLEVGLDLEGRKDLLGLWMGANETPSCGAHEIRPSWGEGYFSSPLWTG
jgi:transposase-like protein